MTTLQDLQRIISRLVDDTRRRRRMRQELAQLADALSAHHPARA